MLLDPAFALEVRNPGLPVGPADGAEHQVRHACGLGCIGDVHAVLRLRLHPGGGGSHRENAGDAGERGAQARRVLDVRSGQCRALRCESASRRRTGVAHKCTNAGAGSEKGTGCCATLLPGCADHGVGKVGKVRHCALLAV